MELGLTEKFGNDGRELRPVFRMMASSRLMNHLGLTALLDFVRFVEKLLHFLRRLCFRFDVTNFQANLPAVARMQPSTKDSRQCRQSDFALFNE